MAKENVIQSAILEYLNSIPGCIAENVHGNSFTGSGRPDINACYKGKSLRIEVKSKEHNNKPSSSQELNLKMWARAGSISMVAYSLKDVKDVIELCIDHELPCSGCPVRAKKQCFCEK